MTAFRNRDGLAGRTYSVVLLTVVVLEKACCWYFRGTLPLYNTCHLSAKVFAYPNCHIHCAHIPLRTRAGSLCAQPLPATMAVSVLPLIALVLMTLHICNAASAGPELAGEPGDPSLLGRGSVAHRVIQHAMLLLPLCLPCPTCAVEAQVCQAVPGRCCWRSALCARAQVAS
jgi:hypothetical protein